MCGRAHYITPVRTAGRKYGDYPYYVRHIARKIDRTKKEVREFIDDKRFRGALYGEIVKWLASFNLWDLEEEYGHEWTNLDADINPSFLISEYLNDMNHNFYIPSNSKDDVDFSIFYLFFKLRLLKNLGEDYINQNHLWDHFFYDREFLATYGFLIKPEALLQHYDQDTVAAIMTQNYH